MHIAAMAPAGINIARARVSRVIIVDFIISERNIFAVAARLGSCPRSCSLFRGVRVGSLVHHSLSCRVVA